PPTGPVDALAGIVSAGGLPMGRITNPTASATPPNNTTGWAYWVGTSFATPIVSALAAAFWEIDGSLVPVDPTGLRPSVLDKVQAAAPGSVAGLGCRGLEVRQS